MFWVVAYDVASNRRRRKLLERLKDYGFAVQRSLVECDLDGQRFTQMREEALALIDRRKDALHFYPLCGNCQFKAERYGNSICESRAEAARP